MVRLTSFDYKTVATSHASQQSAIDQGEAGNALASTLEDFDPRGHYYASGGDSLDRHAQIRQEAHDFLAKQFSGMSTARAAAVGTSFRLADHYLHDQQAPEQRQFTIVLLVCEALNNFVRQHDAAAAPAGAGRSDAADVPPLLAPWFGNGKGLLADPRPGGACEQPYRNILSCVRRGVPIRPRYAHSELAKPTAPGPMTATVVGPADAEVFTDELGRIKIQFDWQLPQHHPEGGAAHNEKSSAWVRVAQSSAGAGWGTQHIPRVGQEVVILFLNGDIDRPICIGVAYNGSHLPPAFSGAGSLPANKALSGVKTKEHHADGYNQLRFDDTREQISAQLMSLHARTELNLGWLGTARQDGKSAPRGEGFELTTEAAGAIRAARSLLLTAEQQQPGGVQLMRSAAIQSLTAALALVERIGDEAAEAEANQPETGRGNTLIDQDSQPGAREHSGHQTQLKEALDNLECGFNNDPQGNTGQGEQRGGQGIVAITSPNGTAVSSQQSVTIAAGTNLDQVAQRDTNQTSGRRWIHNIGESASLFVSGAKARIEATFKITVARGNLLQRVLGGDYRVEANGDIRLKTKGALYLEAEKGVWIKGEGGTVHVGNDISLHNPGSQSQKASDFRFSGPASDKVALTLPQATPKTCSWKNREAISKGEAGVPIN